MNTRCILSILIVIVTIPFLVVRTASAEDGLDFIGWTPVFLSISPDGTATVVKNTKKNPRQIVASGNHLYGSLIAHGGGLYALKRLKNETTTDYGFRDISPGMLLGDLNPYATEDPDATERFEIRKTTDTYDVVYLGEVTPGTNKVTFNDRITQTNIREVIPRKTKPLLFFFETLKHRGEERVNLSVTNGPLRPEGTLVSRFHEGTPNEQVRYMRFLTLHLAFETDRDTSNLFESSRHKNVFIRRPAAPGTNSKDWALHFTNSEYWAIHFHDIKKPTPEAVEYLSNYARDLQFRDHTSMLQIDRYSLSFEEQNVDKTFKEIFINVLVKSTTPLLQFSAGTQAYIRKSLEDPKWNWWLTEKDSVRALQRKYLPPPTTSPQMDGNVCRAVAERLNY